MTVTSITYMTNTEKQSGVSGLPTQLLVNHSMECPLQGGYAASLTKWANTPLNQGGPEASWHWGSDPIAVVAMVPPELAAWHASAANSLSEGFEQAGYARFSRAEWLTEDGKRSIDNHAWIMAQRMKANGIPHRWLTNAEVTAVVYGGNRTIKGLCNHRQIDPATRTDPGDGYPFDYLNERISHHLGATIVPQSATQEDDDLDAEAKGWIKETRDRVLGRGVQRYYNPNNIADVRTEPFPGCVAARSADVHDIMALHTLVNGVGNRILDAVAKVPGVDGSVVEGIRDELREELHEGLKGLTVTLSVPVETEAGQ